jgi:tRNA-specific 2-thiouridylase
MRQTYLVALSGGVDSAVVAWLLKSQGLAVEGVYMRTWMDEGSLEADCPWEADRSSAKAVADHLGIPFRVINMIDVYKEKVVEYLVQGYKAGSTPNPDIMCNQAVKFGALLQYALDEGFDGLATGHYVRKVYHNQNTWHLLEGLDKLKDQSYFLAMVSRQALDHALFPLGDFEKPQVREMAHKAQLPNADRKDSQGICFLGKVKIQDFLEHYLPENEGPIINLEGKVLGQHKGLHRYTIGQRKGIGVPSNTDFENYVVVKKDQERNALIVAFDHPGTPHLYTEVAYLRDFNWLEAPVTDGATILARVRYRDAAVPAVAHWERDRLRLQFHEHQRGLAPGQIVAFYEGPTLLGGGILEHP